MKTEFVNDAKVMAKGQVTIPKNVREALGIDVGDRVTFIVDGSDIKIMNSAIYALKRLQKQMAGEADKAGITSENDIAEWITKSRREENAQ
ncbi:AbrB/MazE/SpoVT family DNA-binding domain-containing protein [Oribacterium sp. HCP28S3_H8]|uniref:AbrB/MazE/SpoVT family DNA-binding domain-containing protein n=1 Tax=Oribacterium sp. HCP28S3_H8 TaxID=3438945 RepID=UPI003F89F0C1